MVKSNRFGSVIAVSIEPSDFKNFVLLPAKIIKPNGDGVQLMIERNGKAWCRSYCNGSYQNWIDLDEASERINQLKNINS